MPSSARHCFPHVLPSFPTRRSSDLAVRLPAPRRVRGCRGRAAALRGTHRLPLTRRGGRRGAARPVRVRRGRAHRRPGGESPGSARVRSEEHTSELQSLTKLVCRLLLAIASLTFSPLSLHDALPISRFAFRLPDEYADAAAAPLLCAGLIGYRSLVAAGDAERLGLYGFGAAAHIVAQEASHQGRRVFAFTRAGDTTAQRFALELGAAWAGDSEAAPPEPLDAAIIYAPVGALVPSALRAVVPGGTVVCAGIHMTDIPAFPYQLLWGERVVRSIANLTRRDGEEFLALAPRVPVHTQIESFPLDQANEALNRLRAGAVRGAAVLAVNSPAA